jgi:hypothetical protein
VGRHLGTVTTIAGIFQAEKRKEISGVVGSYETTRQSIEVGTTQALFLLALIIRCPLGVDQPVPVPAGLTAGTSSGRSPEKVRAGRSFSGWDAPDSWASRVVIGLCRDRFSNDIGRLNGRGLRLRLTISHSGIHLP